MKANFCWVLEKYKVKCFLHCTNPGAWYPVCLLKLISSRIGCTSDLGWGYPYPVFTFCSWVHNYQDGCWYYINQYCQINNSKLKFNNIELSAVIYLMVTGNHDNLSSANNFAFKAVLLWSFSIQKLSYFLVY